VGIGTTSPVSGYKLEVQGYTYFDVGARDVVINYSGAGSNGPNTEPCVRSTSNDWGNLGNASYRWWRTHTRYIYRQYEVSISDRRVKQNIQPISDPIGKIMRLNGVSYDINPSTHPYFNNTEKYSLEETRDHLGFIAQELKEVLPELVIYDETSDYYAVKNYEQLLPVIVEAIKQQQREKQAMQQHIETLEQRLEKLESLVPGISQSH